MFGRNARIFELLKVTSTVVITTRAQSSNIQAPVEYIGTEITHLWTLVD